MSEPWSEPGEQGSIILLTAGMMTVVLMVLVGVTQAARVFLAQRSLAGVCDGAAVAAAQAVEPAGIYAGTRIWVDPTLARQRITGFTHTAEALSDAPGAHLALDSVTHDRVRVVCTRSVRLPFVDVLAIGPVTVRVHATAQIGQR